MDISKFFVSLNSVSAFLRKVFLNFFSTFYEYDNGYYLFITALLPFMLMFVVDILLSFIFSIRGREIRFFNVLSPKSWKLFNSQTYNRLPAERLKPMTLTNRNVSLFQPYTYRVNDVLRLKCGLRATYLGIKYVDGHKAYIYKVNHKIYSSTLSPGKMVRFGKIQFNFIKNHNYNNYHITNNNGNSKSYDES